MLPSLFVYVVISLPLVFAAFTRCFRRQHIFALVCELSHVLSSISTFLFCLFNLSDYPKVWRFNETCWDKFSLLEQRCMCYGVLNIKNVPFIWQMLARFATGASFSADSRGGGKESNSKFLPFMIQMARQLLDHDSSQRSNLAKSIATYLSSPTLESKSSTSPGGQPSNGTEETVQFMMVSSLLSDSYESWLQHRRTFLQRGIYHAYMQRHGRSIQRSSLPGSTSAGQSGDAGGSDELFATIQPMLLYTGLIEQLQCYFKVRKSSTVDTVQMPGTSNEAEGEDESKKLEAWEVVMKERLLNVKDMVAFSKELLSWLDDMTSATDLQESFDIIGALSDVLGSGYTRCEDFVHASIHLGKC